MSNNKKTEQLGMPFGTASARLKKMILFNFLQRLGEDICYRCNKKIEQVEDLSIEHKKSWLNVSSDLFWDLNNIAFSHLVCNSSNGGSWDRVPIQMKHGTRSCYKYRKCRCISCKNANNKYEKARRMALRRKGNILI